MGPTSLESPSAGSPAPEAMSADQAAVLGEFARTCKTAARAVSLYPGDHPAIASALSRVVAAGNRLTRDGSVTIRVHPDTLTIEGRAPLRPDPAVGELASLLLERLVGLLTVRPGIDPDDWHGFLPLLAKLPADLIAEGGIAEAWSRTGRSHLEVREINYADVLRERGGSHAEWDRIVASCLRGDADALDDRALASLIEALEDPTRFGKLLERFQIEEDADLNVRMAALLELMRAAIDAAAVRGEAEGEQALQTIAASCSALTPDVMIAMITNCQSGAAGESSIGSAVLTRMTNETIAAFAVRTVAADQGASERLAQALDALAPSTDRKKAVLELANAKAQQRESEVEEGFDRIWQNAAGALVQHWVRSYSDNAFVSEQYGRELTDATVGSVETRRMVDDPPERVQAWTATVSEAALRELDRHLLIDLLRIEEDPARWEAIATIAGAEVTRLTGAGDTTGAETFIDAIGSEAGDNGRSGLRATAARQVERLCEGSLARLVAVQFRTADQALVEGLGRLCQRLGPGMVPALTDSLARETNRTAVQRLATLLFGFGAAGRQSVEQLKLSPNPAVRRIVITLLRGAGKQEALTALTLMLEDRDPEVQRESLRAIVELGTSEAFAVLQRLFLQAETHGALVHELVGLRNDNAAVAFCHLLSNSTPRGKLYNAHVSMIEALGSTKTSESTRTLERVLHRGDWWAPYRTATLRQAAATALRRIGTPEAVASLESAAASGSRGVRKAALLQLARPSRRETGA